jgi:heme O synthase-like polyprenyltransferase
VLPVTKISNVTTRTIIAFVLVFSIVGMFWYILVVFGHHKDVLIAVVTTITNVLFTVLGVYFGTSTLNKPLIENKQP